MEQDKIIEGNKAIAKFCGCEIKPNRAILRDNDGIVWGKLFENLEYHSSWGWLMPVVEKIENIGATVYIRKSICEIAYLENDTGYCEVTEATPSKITAVWQSIIQFINWYNTNKQKQ